jgi:hypothetical protein
MAFCWWGKGTLCSLVCKIINGIPLPFGNAPQYRLFLFGLNLNNGGSESK